MSFRRTFNSRVLHLRAIVSGALLKSVPQPHVVRNRGKNWSPAEEERLQGRFRELRAMGATQNAIVTMLSAEFERGAWAIRKRLRSSHLA